MQVEYSRDFCIVHAEKDILDRWEDDLIALNGYYRPQTKAGRAGYYFLVQQAAQITDFVKAANAGTITPKQIAQSTPVSRPHIKRRVNYLDYEVQVNDEAQVQDEVKTPSKSQGVRVITMSPQRPANYIPAPLIKAEAVNRVVTTSSASVTPKAVPKTAQAVRTITMTHARPAHHIPSAYVPTKSQIKPSSATSSSEPLNPAALREFINSKSDVVDLLNTYGDHPRVKELLQQLMALSV